MPAPPIALGGTLGATYIGIVLSSIVYGVSCLQTYNYFTEHSSGDSSLFKMFVGMITACDTLHTALVITIYYHYTVTNFGNFAGLEVATWSLICEVTVGAFLSTSIQWFFAYRVHRLGGRKVLIPVMIIVLATTQFVLSGIVYVHKVFMFPNLTDQSANLPFATASFAVHLACDVLITTSMAYYLAVTKSLVRRTNKAINLLIKYTMNTFLLTSICTLIALATITTMPQSLIYAAVYFILVRVETCSLLCLLNSRDHVRQALDGQGEPITLSAFTNANGNTETGKPHAISTGASVNGSSYSDATLGHDIKSGTQTSSFVV